MLKYSGFTGKDLQKEDRSFLDLDEDLKREVIFLKINKIN